MGNEHLAANTLRILSKNKSITPITGSIITNGGIGCYNINIEADLTCNTISSQKISTDVLELEYIKISHGIIPTKPIDIGTTNFRWNTLFTNNITSKEINTNFLNINNQFVITNNIKCNMPIIINDKLQIGIKYPYFVVDGNIKMMNNFIEITNSKIKIKGELETEDIIINKFLSIEPESITIENDCIVDVISSIMILNIKNNVNLTLNINMGRLNYCLVDFILENINDYNVTICLDTNVIIQKSFRILFIKNKNEIITKLI